MWREDHAPEFLVVSNRESLAEAMEGANALVIVMFQGHLQRLLRDGIPAERVILYLSHVRIGLALPGLNRLHAVLTLNGQEHSLLRIAGVEPQRLHRFPAGYDPGIFFRPYSGSAPDRCVAGRALSAHNKPELSRAQAICLPVRAGGIAA